MSKNHLDERTLGRISDIPHSNAMSTIFPTTPQEDGFATVHLGQN